MKFSFVKSILQVLFVADFIFINAQMNSKNILKSTNVEDIESFLASAHPDDHRKIVLKKKLIRLKNESWTRSNVRPSMEARAIEVSDIKTFLDEDK